ncbi:MAG: NAD(P)H-binding protein, partial [Alphaproteobacteria bacterium]|nr:NAD(P)H-binding protein [Alphaproteobacteria bacterium]
NVNVLSTVALADAAAAHHVKKCIFISTIGASHSYAHKYGYPGSKQKAEAYLQGKDDLNWTIVRPDIVYSEQSWGHSFSFDELSGLKFIPMIGDGKQKLQPIHLDDLAKTVNLLSNGKANHETLNACGSEALEIREILQFLSEKRQRKFKTISLSVAFAEAVAKHYPVGVLNPSFVGMLREAMENPSPKIDATPFMQAVGLEKLITLQEAYEGTKPADMNKPKVMQMVKQVALRPLRLFSLTAEFARAAVRRTPAVPQIKPEALEIQPESLEIKPEVPTEKEVKQTPKLPSPETPDI